MDDEQLKVAQAVVDSHKPLGDWSNKPAVPATTVPATNTTDCNMWVEVAANGATIATVKVDGVTIGARTVGAFRVRPGSTITLAYTVATPTWQWFYE
jgi:hypothetical protein